MKRRIFLAATGASVFLRPQFAQAEKLVVSYKQEPPYFSYHGLIEPGHDAFIEEAAAYRRRKPSLPVAPHPNPWFREVTGSVLDSEQLRKGVPYLPCGKPLGKRRLKRFCTSILGAFTLAAETVWRPSALCGSC